MEQIICRKIGSTINFQKDSRNIASFGKSYVINWYELPNRFILDKIYAKRFIHSDGYYEPRLGCCSQPYTTTTFNMHGNVRLEHVFIQLREES